MTIEAVGNLTLRTVKRLDGEAWTTIRMIELKKGDIFQLFEADGVLVGDRWLATEDATPDPQREGLGKLMAEPYVSN